MQHTRPLSSLLVTGGAGFIGSAFIRYLLRNPHFSGKVVNLDALTYAADLNSLKAFENHPRYRFIQGDIKNQPLVEKMVLKYEIDTIVHFAAETHVDRSITSAYPFVETNVIGTLSLLETVRKFPSIHFHHISTDEVYGSLGESGFFNEQSPYRPNSPYSASKAASDHLVRSFHNTYGLSTTLSHCINNFGPYQNVEKFIPLMISNCLANKPLPIYGRGTNIRDWLYVEDHAEAIFTILQNGKKGEIYDIGGDAEFSNLEALHILIDLLSLETQKDPAAYFNLIRFITDRPGHDFRYAIDSSKIKKTLHWHPKISFSQGLLKTIRWYIRDCLQTKLQKTIHDSTDRTFIFPS
jgi:dTDP-glucose 4,6-dehydratase